MAKQALLNRRYRNLFHLGADNEDVTLHANYDPALHEVFTGLSSTATPPTGQPDKYVTANPGTDFLTTLPASTQLLVDAELDTNFRNFFNTISNSDVRWLLAGNAAGLANFGVAPGSSLVVALLLDAGNGSPGIAVLLTFGSPKWIVFQQSSEQVVTVAAQQATKV